MPTRTPLAHQRALVIGGGFSGMAAAIQLRKHGCAVDLLEIDPEWRSYGAGISLGGATLRAFRTLGILDAFLREGAGSDGVELFLASGQPLGTVPTPRIVAPDVPGSAAILRPVLARILADAVRASGTQVRLGCTFQTIEADDTGVDVRLTDGTQQRYDFVIGADGMYSKVRQALIADAPTPRYSGQAVWRAVLPRPPAVQRAMMWLGPKVKTGVNPVSAEEMYLFVTEDRAVQARIDPADFPALLAGLLAPFPAPLMQTARSQVLAGAPVVFRPLCSLLLPQPWHRRRVVLIGDTVHATTPHLAAGACIGIEDALVLADELAGAETVEGGFAAYGARRWERCRMVVENSGRLGDIEIAGGSKEEHAQILRSSMAALCEPI